MRTSTFLRLLFLVLLVFGCKKDVNETLMQPENDSFTIEAAKNHFSKVQEKIKSIEKSARDTKRSRKFIRKVLWEYAHSYTSMSGEQVIAVPAFFDDDLNNPTKHSYRKLLYRENAKTKKLEGIVMEYLPDEEYFRKNFGKISAKTFTGKIVYYSEEGSFIEGIELKDGSVAGSVVVGLEGSIMASEKSKGGKAYYNGCEVTDIQANCTSAPPINSNSINVDTRILGTTNEPVLPQITDQGVLNHILAYCKNVFLTLSCPGDGGGSATTIYNYTPTTGGVYTPNTGPTPGGSTPGTPGYIGPTLSDEQWEAINFAGSDDRFTIQEKNYLLYNVWVAYALQENNDIKSCLFSPSTYHNKSALISCLNSYLVSSYHVGLTAEEVAILSSNEMNSIEIALYVYNAINVHVTIEYKNWTTSHNYNRDGAGDSDHPNAIKHAMLAAINKQTFGEPKARKLANAHENNSTLATVNHYPTLPDGLNRLMDLQNNEIGLQFPDDVWIGYGNYGMTQLFDYYLPKAQNGDLYVWMVKGGNRYTVAKRTFNQ